MNGVAVASGVAGAIVASARAAGFDRDRSFYPTVLAVMAETAVALGFVAVAGVAFRRRSPALLAAGLALHGLWDVAHPALLPASDAVPAWWPAFCLGVDLPLAAWAHARWPLRSHAKVPAPSRGAGPAAP